MALLHCKMCFK